MTTPDPHSNAIESTAPAASLPGWYGDLLGAVSGHVSSGRRRALASVNSELVQTYWRIGREILDRQHDEGYGHRVIERLSSDLRSTFPDAKGFLAPEPQVHAVLRRRLAQPRDSATQRCTFAVAPHHRPDGQAR